MKAMYDSEGRTVNEEVGIPSIKSKRSIDVTFNLGLSTFPLVL